MMRTNQPARSALYSGTTHEGAPARVLTPEQTLSRSVMACMLFEAEFYEDGKSVADRIKELVPQVSPVACAAMALRARREMHLRHVPLLLAREMARATPEHRVLVADLLGQIILRADELAEFVALYQKDGKDQPLSAQVKRGLAQAIGRFDAYQLAKYNRDHAVRLRDVVFLAHPSPNSQKQAQDWAQLVNKSYFPKKYDEQAYHPQGEYAPLATPDTWEVAISATKGEKKGEEWTRLLTENKLGPLALIRNLRNFIENKVDEALVREALKRCKAERVLPFRFISAVNHAPQFAKELEDLMLRNLQGQERIAGLTILLVDVSASMDDPISAKSELRRVDAAAGLAVMAREICDAVRVCTFSNRFVEVPAYRGLGLVDVIKRSQHHAGTLTGDAIAVCNQAQYDRVILITDEQSHQAYPAPTGRGYCINVASAKPGIGYGPWHHIDGWSEAVLSYIRAVEASEAA